MLIHGVEEIGYTTSFFINFFGVSSFFLLLLPPYLNQERIERILSKIKTGIFFISLYGIFLFFFKIITGKFFLIPFLTVNFHDLYTLEETKCIDRGGIFKLISTYNNGNLFGVCVLMLLPLYTALEKKKIHHLIVKSSLILTLSRTVWIGLVAFELLDVFFFEKSLRKKSFLFIGHGIFIVSSFFILSFLFPLSLDFFFDRFLGHRIGQFEALDNLDWFSSKAFQGIWEVIYLGILSAFGLSGLISFLWAFLLPPFAVFFQKEPLGLIQKRAAFGLYLYLFVAASDGALLLIPVLTFCFFLLFLLSSEPQTSS